VGNERWLPTRQAEDCKATARRVNRHNVPQKEGARDW
jgi:hypothetical protein